MNDQGPDIWIPILHKDRVDVVNADSGERRYGEEAKQLVGMSDKPVWYVPRGRWLKATRAA